MGSEQQSTKSTPRGVNIRGKSLQVAFSFRGVECRETLKLDPTAANIRYAERLRAEILNAIERQTFRYSDYFPNSKRAALFGHAVSSVTVGQLLDKLIAQTEKTLEFGTWNEYRKAVEFKLKPKFGAKRITNLIGADIRDWVVERNVTIKTISNDLIPLRHVVEQALSDGLIERNPFAGVILKKLVNKETASTDYEVDPLNRREIAAVVATAEGQLRNQFQFAIYSGLRTGELMALRWEDIDFVNGIIKVRRAISRKREKGTKTNAGKRDVLMLPPARAALLEQKRFTLTDRERFAGHGRVFINPYTKAPWTLPDQINQQWGTVLKRAGVRARNAYQTRHTYASMLLSAGENIMWVSNQLGHVDTEMVIRTYGRWIPDPDKQGGYQPVNDWQLPSEKLA
ncbi:Arm DNA-binding domain-containing protein [Chromobacterium haemolyticum]|uniref:Arm DNA-binding domain-containing protein n=1 Tax=Chromobacterium TaxID=535 RepID=UPI004055AD66